MGRASKEKKALTRNVHDRFLRGCEKDMAVMTDLLGSYTKTRNSDRKKTYWEMLINAIKNLVVAKKRFQQYKKDYDELDTMNENLRKENESLIAQNRELQAELLKLKRGEP